MGLAESAALTPSWSMITPPATTETCLCCQGSGISLPCTGGSPLLDLAEKDRKPAQEAYFRLLSHSGKYIAYSNKLSLIVVSTSLELPKSNRFWTDSILLEFLSAHAMEKYADCSACAAGLSTSQGQPIGKVFRIACSDEVFATGLEKRFQCKCTRIMHL